MDIELASASLSKTATSGKKDRRIGRAMIYAFDFVLQMSHAPLRHMGHLCPNN